MKIIKDVDKEIKAEAVKKHLGGIHIDWYCPNKNCINNTKYHNFADGAELWKGMIVEFVCSECGETKRVAAEDYLK